MNPQEPDRCPKCGAEMLSHSQETLCSACLLHQALVSQTLDNLSQSTTLGPPPSPEEIADKFPGYDVVECLGRGGMGVVYKARQKSLDRWVAIKVLAPERVDEERFGKHFESEAKTLAKMSHTNIVTVFDHGETEGLFYIVMEYVDGVNLRNLLSEGKMEPEQALAIVPPICEALEYAHDKGVVHRDIKPENLLLDRDGSVKIADFGIASLVGTTGEKSGTPPYMAPEQSGGTVDRRADIYALGIVLYEMLTGERPGKELVAPSSKVEVDVKIDEMVLRALESEPERRYQTAGEFCTVVQTISQPAEDSGAKRIPTTKSPVSLWMPALIAHVVTNTLWMVSECSELSGHLRLKLEVFPWFLVSWLVGCALWAGLHYQCWRALPMRHRVTTPGKAIGLLFVPFFNFYWAFISFPKLADGFNEARGEKGRAPDVAMRTMAIFYAINFVFYWTVAWDPRAGVFICVIDLLLFVMLYQRFVREAHAGEFPVESEEVTDRAIQRPSVGLANLALGLAVLGALIPVCSLLSGTPENLEGSIVRGITVSVITLSVLVAAMALGWRTRRLLRGKVAMIVVPLSLLIGTLSIIVGLERPIAYDLPIIVRSQDRRKSAMGQTLHSMQMFGSDRISYRLQVQGTEPSQTWMAQVPLYPAYGRARSFEEISFEKHGKIVWSEDGELVTFSLGHVPIAEFDTEALSWEIFQGEGSTAVFGPVIERVISGEQLAGGVGLDLDSGEIMMPSRFGGDRLRARGADLQYHSGKRGWWGLALNFSASNVPSLKHIDARSLLMIQWNGTGSNMRIDGQSCFFETREGNHGSLQILPIAGSKDVKVRYRLVRLVNLPSRNTSKKTSQRIRGEKEALEKFGVEKLDPINKGFVFMVNKYIEPPYILERRGLGIFLNGHRIWQYPPYDYRVPVDPGPAPAGTMAFAELPEGADLRDTWLSRKSRYLDQHFPENEAFKKLLAIYKSLSNVVSAEPVNENGMPGNIFEVKTNDGRSVLVFGGGMHKVKAPATDDELLGRAREKMDFYRQSLANFGVMGFGGAASEYHGNGAEVIKSVESWMRWNTDSPSYKAVQKRLNLYKKMHEMHEQLSTAPAYSKHDFDELEKRVWLSSTPVKEVTFPMPNEQKPIFIDLDEAKVVWGNFDSDPSKPFDVRTDSIQKWAIKNGVEVCLHVMNGKLRLQYYDTVQVQSSSSVEEDRTREVSSIEPYAIDESLRERSQWIAKEATDMERRKKLHYQSRRAVIRDEILEGHSHMAQVFETHKGRRGIFEFISRDAAKKTIHARVRWVVPKGGRGR